MFNSVNKRIYDLVLSKLNENTQGVTFDGNFMFKFYNGDQQNFEIIVRDEDLLDFESQRIVPVVDAQNIQVPFVDDNDRSDFEREFYIAIQVESTVSDNNQVKIEFDETITEYQALLETIENIKSTLTFIDGDYKYTFKVKEPTKVSYFKYNGIYYQVLALTINLTSLQNGYFGNETAVYFGLKSDVSFADTATYKLDFLEFTPNTSKETRANADTDATETSVAINKRTWIADMTVNFTGNTADLLLQREIDAIVDNNLIYQVKVVKNQLGTDLEESYEYTRDVYVTSCNATYIKNDVDKITFRLERA